MVESNTMSRLSTWWRGIVNAIKSAFTWTTPETEPQPEPEPQLEPEQKCTCDLSKPLVEPDKGEECPVPWGVDVRFLAWSPSKHDWVFIGFMLDSATYKDGKITGRCFVKNGLQYHYMGQRQRSSSATMILDRTVECKPCHRVYFEARQA